MVSWDNEMRTDLALLIREFVGDSPEMGAEIGVDKGWTSKTLLKNFRLCKMVFVDPWVEWKEGDSFYRHSRTGKLTQAEWDAKYTCALWNIGLGMKRSEITPDILRKTSIEAAPLYNNKVFDFVFIDSCHFYEDVKNDINAWLPKMKKGGLLCGHDYGGYYIEVQKAVNDVLGKENIIQRDNRLWGYVV